MTMRYASVCTGISAETAAWKSLGWTPAWFAEIEPFPCKVLRHYYPEVPNRGDITQFNQWPDDRDEPISVLTGGTPCQDFSVAGLRAGMDGARGNLSLTFISIAAKYRPRWLVWENVCGVFSTNGGRDFAQFLAGLTGRKVEVPKEGWGTAGIIEGIEEAYGVAWRVLDSQFTRVESHPFAVPQRRRRVFVVGHLGGLWQRAAAVLFERAGLRGASAPRRTAAKGVTHSVAQSLTASGRGTERTGESRGQDSVVAVAHSLRADGFDAIEDRTERGTPLVPEVCGALSDGAHNGDGLNGQDAYTGRILPVAESLRCKRPGEGGINGDYTHIIPEVSPALNTQSGSHHAPDTKAYVALAFPERLSGTQCASTEELSPSLGATNPTAIAFQPRIARNGRGNMGDVVNALNAESGSTGKGDSAPCVAITGLDPQLNADADLIGALNIGSKSGSGQAPRVGIGMAVRRLTPRECERLMGHRDDLTLIPVKGKLAADGPRYKALGNGQTVNVMNWIGQRIQMVEDLTK